MGQVTIYLDDDTERKMAENAAMLNVSKSKWIANVIREKLVEDWPSNIRALPGAWRDIDAVVNGVEHDTADTERESL